ncbi:MAG: tRNA pseudouridine(38-40) synthase TruA [Chitinophagales bacterium]|nr:tRNA pseudouridine(38-40) synthase TruA [Chitinophagales bacterium]MDW8419737.1 tRNA pseudouridine synthase A [Chitinophagales bacterium]
MRYFIRLCYDGTHYCGWQVQHNAPSVQQTINNALEKLLRHPVASMGCGRTDTGVHAKEFYMHFDTPDPVVDTAGLLFRLNGMLPADIAIRAIITVHDQAHARYDATERTYEYYVHFDKSPFINRYSFYQGYYTIDWDIVLEATEFLRSVQDFTSLCLPSDDFKTNICKISEMKWQVLPAHFTVLEPYSPLQNYPELGRGSRPKTGELYRFTVTSNRFLRGMIRKIVGTLLMAGKGKISLNEFQETVLARRDFRVHHLAPPNGLFLSRVCYPYLHENIIITP